MRLILIVPLILLHWLALSTLVAASAQTDRVLDALKISELLQIMEKEAVLSGADLDQSMLGGTGGAAWQRIIARINDAERVEEDLRAAFAETMPEEMTFAAVAFLTSEQGREIIGLEISARRALLDPSIDAFNRAQTEMRRADGGLRIALIDQFVETNNLIDANVAGALTGNVAFLQGLRRGGFPPYARASDADLMAEVWSREPDLRADTEEWVYSYLLLAYQPLETADMETYLAFSATEAGAALNRALFEAFDEVMSKTSAALGEAVARQLMAEEI